MALEIASGTTYLRADAWSTLLNLIIGRVLLPILSSLLKQDSTLLTLQLGNC